MILNPFRALFFTVFGYNSPRIESTSLDGNNRRVIIGYKIVYPVGLTLDLANKYIYWIGKLQNYFERFLHYYLYFIFTNDAFVDTYLDVIERAGYDGANRKTVKKGRLVIK